MGQIELFNILLGIIIISYFKPYNRVQMICIILEYLINRNTNSKTWNHLPAFKQRINIIHDY